MRYELHIGPKAVAQFPDPELGRLGFNEACRLEDTPTEIELWDKVKRRTVCYRRLNGTVWTPGEPMEVEA